MTFKTELTQTIRFVSRSPEDGFKGQFSGEKTGFYPTNLLRQHHEYSPHKFNCLNPVAADTGPALKACGRTRERTGSNAIELRINKKYCHPERSRRTDIFCFIL
ncbi:hypothetical protein [Pedobacter endophyticus]|uniref:Uncharacterized protein n=1 Tax=Pedobacter endophyticus TaxID=2789740 RepID=A0A7S9PZL8_9SPHI|nr:hypothetical protein [Pedobacter endophyticus]QPH40668.1 hypothetical protein IZT61_05185 [Pedobacter endophyticus]